MPREDIIGQHNTDNDMRVRRITLADGRYMIFYTFDEAHDVSAGLTSAAEHVDASAAEPQATNVTPIATEEEQGNV